MHSSALWGGLVHSLEVDCWSKIYWICQRTVFVSSVCFWFTSQQRKYSASVLIHCPLEVLFLCRKNLLGHRRIGECWELEFIRNCSKLLQETLSCTITASMNRQFLGSLGWVLRFLKVSTVIFVLVKSLSFSDMSVVTFRNLKWRT